MGTVVLASGKVGPPAARVQILRLLREEVPVVERTQLNKIFPGYSPVKWLKPYVLGSQVSGLWFRVLGSGFGG